MSADLAFHLWQGPGVGSELESWTLCLVLYDSRSPFTTFCMNNNNELCRICRTIWQGEATSESFHRVPVWLWKRCFIYSFSESTMFIRLWKQVPSSTRLNTVACKHPLGRGQSLYMFPKLIAKEKKKVLLTFMQSPCVGGQTGHLQQWFSDLPFSHYHSLYEYCVYVRAFSHL